MKSKDLSYLILCLSLLLLSPTLHGQHFSIKGGLNAANVTGDMADIQWGGSFPTRQLTTFHLEAVVDFSVYRAFSFQTGIRYTGKGHRHFSQALYQFPFLSYVAEVESRIYYLDIPLTLRMAIPLAGCQTYFFGGGYLGMGLHGKTIFKTTYVNRSKDVRDRSVKFGEDGDYKRFDYGGLFGVGMHFGSLFFEVSYSLGLPDLSLASYPVDYNNRNRLLSVSLGYRLMNKSKKNKKEDS